MRLNCDSMDNAMRFGRLNIGITAPKGFNRKTDKDQISMQVIFNDTPAEQDAVYINGKKLGSLSQLRGVENQYQAERVLGRLSQGDAKVMTRDADPTASFTTGFKGLLGVVKGAFASSPAMTVSDVWTDRKPDILRRAYLASVSYPMGFSRVPSEQDVTYDALNAKDMRVQGQKIVERINNGRFVTVI